jgi:enoyl-CoA hydratase
MVLPISAIEIMRNRLTRSAFQRAVSMAAVFTAADAVAAGWLDEVVEDGNVLARAHDVASAAAAGLHLKAHRASKLKARHDAIAAIQAGIDGLPAEFTAS